MSYIVQQKNDVITLSLSGNVNTIYNFSLPPQASVVYKIKFVALSGDSIVGFNVNNLIAGFLDVGQPELFRDIDESKSFVITEGKIVEFENANIGSIICTSYPAAFQNEVNPSLSELQIQFTYNYQTFYK